MNIEIILGDITQQPDCEAIVNAANPMLMRGSGVAGAIHKAAGKELEKYCEQYAPIKTCEVIITPGFNLPNRYVLHAVGPKYYQDQNPDDLLMRTYQNILKACAEYQIEKIAIPSISTGSYAFPLEQATLIAIETLLKWDSLHPKMGRLVVFDKQAYMVTLDILKDKKVNSE